MANVTIDNTTKSGRLRIQYNDLYPSRVDHSVQFQINETISAVDILDFAGAECVEVMNNQSFANMFTNDALSERFFPVDTVNGVAPASLSDLRDKILALL